MTDAAISLLATTRVLPVVTIDDAVDAPALVDALAGAGLAVVEITLRTGSALDAIRRASAEVPSAVVGAGSVTSAALATAAIAAGAQFVVAPGLDPDVLRVADHEGVPAVPGVATATELQTAVRLGRTIVKLFPAELIGGPLLVDALAAVWGDVQFVPTGGITEANAEQYLARPQVLAVGGSWMAPRSAIAARDWATVATRASAAARLGARS